MAGSPCQGFSTIGRRCRDDPRNSLFVRAAYLAISTDPEVVVLENVPGLLLGENIKHYNTAISLLNRANFKVQLISVGAEEVGLPQRRKRVFVIASKRKSDLNLKRNLPVNLGCLLSRAESCSNHEPKLLPKGSKDYLIAKVMKQGQKLCDVRGGNRAVHSWEIPQVFGSTTRKQREILMTVMRLRRRIRLRDFGDADPLDPDEITQFLGYPISKEVERLLNKNYLASFGDRIDLSRRFNGKFRRLSEHGLSIAVDTRFGDPRYFLHPRKERGMSVREAARLQGFPDDFVFTGSLENQFRMIGNAVPIPMARTIAQSINQSFFK